MNTSYMKEMHGMWNKFSQTYFNYQAINDKIQVITIVSKILENFCD